MTTFNVSNTTQFNAALASAKGGDSIILAAGNYGSAYLQNKNFSSNVTIKSASSTNKAHFDYVLVNNSSNMRFEGLDVGHALAPGEADYNYMMRVQSSTGIKMVGMSIHGSLDNNPANDGCGLYVTGSSNVQLMGTQFRDLYRGSYFEKDTNVTVSANNYQMIRMDGINVGKIDGIVIDKNVFSNFHPIAGDHADAIQFWQVNQTDGSSNITITNNTVMQGAGTGTQGIFISDPNAVGYKNVLIQNNLLYGNDQYHGISVAGGHGVQIIGNSVLSNSTDGKVYWIQLTAGDNFTVKDNISDKIMVMPGVTGVALSHNVDLSQTPSMASQIPNLNAPQSPTDLIIANYGYHVPGTTSVSSTPVSTVLSADLGSSTNTATSAQTVKTSVADVSGVATQVSEPLPTYSQVFSAPATTTNTSTASSGGQVYGGHSFHSLHFDHFTAMA
ncbi:right-handed parallel beta-helix repeat-containing protein [Sphingomonas tabacisoli]|uniref:Right-handed parallel beta-helix repeat-containing protein n=1 Tax=Sphingomonas tabacisoli TaxID=2249466 RepID=A0ABW4HYU7_9SPHN